MSVRVLIASVWVFICASGGAQLTARFSLEKTVFAQREPVFVIFSRKNETAETLTYTTIIDPEQPFCSGLTIRVSSDPVATATCPGLGGQSCFYDGPLAMLRQLQPGQSYTVRFLLNLSHDIQAPGAYWVEAKRLKLRGGSNKETAAMLNFEVTAENPPNGAYQPWVQQLRSQDRERRLEAGRVLASAAPPELEETLLGFAGDPELRRFAPLAFHRLNTSRSLEAMAHLMDDPQSSEASDAARYLAETGDQRWYPLLREMAERRPEMNSFPTMRLHLVAKRCFRYWLRSSTVQTEASRMPTQSRQ